MGVSSLAGCFGNGDDESTEGEELPDPSETEFVDTAFVTPVVVPPENMQFNPYNDSNYPWRPGLVLFDDFVYQEKLDNTFQPGVVTDWTVTQNDATLEIREGMAWHDGTDITAEDVVRKLKLELYDGSNLGNFVDLETIAAVDDHTVEMEFEQPLGEEMFLNFLMEITLDTPAEYYQDFLEDFEDGGEGENADGETLGEFTIEDPIGSGPFAFEQTVEQELHLERFEDHPDADNINFSGYHFRFLDTNEGRWQEIEAGEIHGLHTVFTPPHIVEGFPGHVREYLLDANFGMGILFDHDHKHFGQQEVRQAIAHVIDRETVASNAGPNTEAPVTTPSGILGNHDGTADEWLGDHADEFNQYEVDTDRAAELLESAGFEQEDGTWVDEDGDVLEFPVKAPSGYSDWVDAIQTFNDALNDFGIEAEFISRDEAAYWGQDIYGDEGFDVALHEWANVQRHPYFSLEWLLDSWDTENVRNYDASEIELPPVGEDSGSETFVPEEDLQNLAVAEDQEAEREYVQRLAWVVNQDLVMLPVMEKQDQSFISTDEFMAASTDDPDAHVDFPTTYLVRQGKLVAREE
ncbi:ABC transporter substrate-binding protein [Natranaeroarchaeum sulfidigenes]|uniref:ABC-type transport system, periplasmic component n=1 Tax=Natranaeroarchaeum sulfidigenes TaxID=2784880 RepID=A0A897MS89_9EURY|nr:ABC transporter substrate-binding protein [Natranaeroarchaeum sulfidigenes]QSG03377.1 ABC-type transport system, periplasmic component [Natranaeroarchaeum sulfidigenes]